jgi:hypothetical protein
LSQLTFNIGGKHALTLKKAKQHRQALKAWMCHGAVIQGASLQFSRFLSLTSKPMRQYHKWSLNKMTSNTTTGNPLQEAIKWVRSEFYKYPESKPTFENVHNALKRKLSFMSWPNSYKLDDRHIKETAKGLARDIKKELKGNAYDISAKALKAGEIFKTHVITDKERYYINIKWMAGWKSYHVYMGTKQETNPRYTFKSLKAVKAFAHEISMRILTATVRCQNVPDVVSWGRISSPSDLKYFYQEQGKGGFHFFDRGTMQFFGDTMRNYGLRDATFNGVPCWELYRRRKLAKSGLKCSTFFSKIDLTTYSEINRIKE